jgi:ChrR Cupin-like domain
MKRRVTGLLPDLVLRGLSEAEMKEVLTLCAAVLPPVAPTPALRARLLASLSGVERFRPFLARLCQIVDLPEQLMRQLLERVDNPSAWEPGPVPGLFLTHFAPGPRISADAGFIRVTAGQTILRHRHLAAEVTLVLEGTFWENGVRYFPGAMLERSAGSVHEFAAGIEKDLVFAITHRGVEIV